MIRRLKLEGRRVKKEAAGGDISKIDRKLNKFMKAMKKFGEKYDAKTFPIDLVIDDVYNNLEDSGMIDNLDDYMSHMEEEAMNIYKKLNISLPISKSKSKGEKEFLNGIWEDNYEEFYDMVNY